jgi:hypothetical protein
LKAPERETTVPQIDAYLEARPHHRRRVEDVMTTEVVTVDPLTRTRKSRAW